MLNYFTRFTTNKLKIGGLLHPILAHSYASKKKNIAIQKKGKGRKTHGKEKKDNTLTILKKFPPGADLNGFRANRSNAEILHLAKAINVSDYSTTMQIQSEGIPYSALGAFSTLCAEDGIKISAFKRRNNFIRPCHKRRAFMYLNRKGKYNNLFDEKVTQLIRTFGHEIQIQ